MPVMGTIQFPRRLLGSSTVAFSLLGLWKICSSCHRQLTILWQHGAAVFAPKQSGLTPRIGKHCAQQQETAAVSPGIHFTGENEQAPSRQRHNMSWKGHWALSPLPLVAAHRARWREPGEPFAQAPRARHAPSVHACRDERWSPLVPSSLLFSSSYWSSYEKTFRVETIRFQPDVTALSTTGQMSSLGEALSFFFFGGGEPRSRDTAIGNSGSPRDVAPSIFFGFHCPEKSLHAMISIVSWDSAATCSQDWPLLNCPLKLSIVIEKEATIPNFSFSLYHSKKKNLPFLFQAAAILFKCSHGLKKREWFPRL